MFKPQQEIPIRTLSLPGYFKLYKGEVMRWTD
jgi:hypothetical protein